MIDHEGIQLALRARLLTLTVADTGSMSLGATTTAYTRATGSFLTDGFRVGMEVDATGFVAANNGLAVITQLTATVMTVDKTLTTQAASAGRQLVAGLPSRQAWENLAFPPDTGKPYVEEQYVPGPMGQETVGPLGQLEVFPLYNVQVHVPENVGIGAAARYADTLIDLFTPRTAMAVGSDTLRVRTDTGPFRGQLRRFVPGFAVVPVTVPLRLRTPNSI